MPREETLEMPNDPRPSLDIYLEGDGAFADWQGREFIQVHHMRMAGLENGTVGGRPSIMIGVELEDGRIVAAETTLRLFLTAADAFRERFGDPRNESMDA